MRTSMLPSLMTVANTNIRARNLEARFFELGRIFQPTDEKLPIETDVLGMCAYGPDEDFFTIKGVIETILENLGIEEYDIVPVKGDPTYHPGRCAELVIDGDPIGRFGEIHPIVAERYELDARSYAARLDVEKLFAHYNPNREYTPLPKFPAVTRDIAVVCDKAVTVGALEDCIRRGARGLLKDVALFDIYTGTGIPNGKKSVAFSLTLRSDERNLTAEEADEDVRNILNLLKSELDAVLR